MKLIFLDSKGAATDFQLEAGSNLIGRWDPDTKSFPEVDLEDFDTENLVSRRHAQIVIEGDKEAILEDLGSTNGTFLSGGVRLEPGVKVTVAVDGEFFVGNLRLKLVR